MTPSIHRVLIVLAGLLLLVTPLFLRMVVWEFNARDYAPGHVGALNRAATPVPTPSPVTVRDPAGEALPELRAGPVVVDLAHGNRLTRAAFEPLAAALAERGLGMQFWLSNVDLLSLTSYYDFPDQSAALRPLLDQASALIVISPFFLWSPQEIALVERFVARGGRLLLISDPDVLGDLAQDINNLAEPFGVVFHDDYLYNTVVNDGNFVHIFQDYFLDRAADIAGANVAFYGARSLGGDVTPQVRTGQNVLSSLRTGVQHFTTVAIGGAEARGTAGRVLAMTDFDVLTQPYVVRHDNERILAFVADFLAGSELRAGVIDFPTFLGKEVTLVFGNASAVDAGVLLQGARLQQSLEATGRTLTLAGAGALTQTLTSALDVNGFDEADTQAPDGAAVLGPRDWLVLADYELAEETTLLAELGFRRVESTPTPTPEPAAPHATPMPDGTPDAMPETGPDEEIGEPAPNEPDTDPENRNSESTAQSGAGPLRAQADSTPTPEQEPGEDPSDGNDEPSSATPEPDDPAPEASPEAAETPTPQPTPPATPAPQATPDEPEVTVYLVRDDGLRLLAGQTILIAQQELITGDRLVAVLGHDGAGIGAGVDRLLSRDYAGCITGLTLVVCSYADGRAAPAATPAPGVTPAPAAPGTPTPTGPDGPPPTDPDPLATPLPTPPPPGAPPEGTTSRVLVVDDNANAQDGERSEADIYLQTLIAQGHAPDLWSTAAQGIPSARRLLEYTWVIWSAGGYEGGGPTLNALDSLLGFINDGGRLTISSRRPFFGMSGADGTPIVDVAVDTGIPQLIIGLPSEPFALQEGLPPVVPLEINPRDNGPRIGLRRGPASESAGAPLLFMVDDADEEDATGARLMIVGMSLTWFTDGHERTLVANMAPLMLDD